MGGTTYLVQHTVRIESALHKADFTRLFLSSRLDEIMQNIDGFSLVLDGMDDLTGFQRDLLYVIGGIEDPAGLRIKDVLDKYYETEIHHGRLYPNLDTLVDKGLVKKGEQDRRTNKYDLTDRGRREVQARRDWEDQYLSELESVEPEAD